MTRYDMDPDGVIHGISRLRAAGDSFDSAWRTRREALLAGVSGLGNDAMTQAFLERYVPIAESLMARNDALAQSYHAVCDDLHGCVNDYLAADTDGTGALARLTGTPTQNSGVEGRGDGGGS